MIHKNEVIRDKELFYDIFKVKMAAILVQCDAKVDTLWIITCFFPGDLLIPDQAFLDVFVSYIMLTSLWSA